MNKKGAVAKDLEAIKSLCNSDICHFVKYDDLVTNQNKSLENI